MTRASKLFFCAYTNFLKCFHFFKNNYNNYNFQLFLKSKRDKVLHNLVRLYPSLHSLINFLHICFMWFTTPKGTRYMHGSPGIWRTSGGQVFFLQSHLRAQTYHFAVLEPWWEGTPLRTDHLDHTPLTIFYICYL